MCVNPCHCARCAQSRSFWFYGLLGYFQLGKGIDDKELVLYGFCLCFER
jgi:hypothetical protein